MAELEVGDPRKLSVDVGPVITREARACDHEPHRNDARPRPRVGPNSARRTRARGTFVPPTLIEVGKVAEVEREVFGPVLHVLRFRRDARHAHRRYQRRRLWPYLRPPHPHRRNDRPSDRADRSRQHLRQPEYHWRDRRRTAVRGLAALGHRAEGRRPALPVAPGLRAAPGALEGVEGAAGRTLAIRVYIDWLRTAGHEAEAERCVGMMARSPLGARVELKGPVGERNRLHARPRGRIAALAASESAALIQIGAILATGNDAVIDDARAKRWR